MGFIFGLFMLAYLLSPLGVWIIIHKQWLRLGKDPKSLEATIIPQYEPFHNLPPALVGVVYDTRANNYDITVTLLDFVARGILTIENRSQVEKRWGGKIHIYHTVDYQLTLIAEKQHAAIFHPYEKYILDAVFTTGTTINLREALNRLGTHLPRIRQQLYDDAVTAGLFTQAANTLRTRYRKASRWLIGIGFVTSLVGIGFPVLCYGLILRLYSHWMAQRTPLGIEAVAWCEGFKLYLYHAERFRAQEMNVESAEKILPYIIVLHLQMPAWQFAFPDGLRALSETQY